MCSKSTLGDGHPHGIRQALSQGAGGGVDARRVFIFRMARRQGVELPKLMEILDCQGITTEVKQRIEHDRCVAIGKDKAIPV